MRQHLMRSALFIAAALVLMGVFTLYTRPAFLVTLIGQIWVCF